MCYSTFKHCMRIKTFMIIRPLHIPLSYLIPTVPFLMDNFWVNRQNSLLTGFQFGMKEAQIKWFHLFQMSLILIQPGDIFSIETGDRLGSSWFSISHDRLENTVSLGHTYYYPRSPWKLCTVIIIEISLIWKIDNGKQWEDFWKRKKKG